MRNLRLLATVLFVAVLLVGIVLLLRQTNVPNDTSVTTTQLTNQQLATADMTDPPIKGKVTPVIKNNSAIQSKLKSLKKAEVKVLRTENAKSAVLESTPRSLVESQDKRTANPSSSSIRWNPQSSKQEQINSLEYLIQNESNAKNKAKYQNKLNTLK